jgi:hypothetical protein
MFSWVCRSNIADLPLNMNSGDFLGFVEGWTFSARYNQVSISMIVSPIAFSLQAMRWNDVPIVEAMEHNQSNLGLDQCHDCGVRRKQVANPTTNYGFVLPTPTDLVTDLPADFDVALQGVDTQLKALQPGTTLGDLAYSSATANTNTRLAIGTLIRFYL